MKKKRNREVVAVMLLAFHKRAEIQHAKLVGQAKCTRNTTGGPPFDRH